MTKLNSRWFHSDFDRFQRSTNFYKVDINQLLLETSSFSYPETHQTFEVKAVAKKLLRHPIHPNKTLRNIYCEETFKPKLCRDIHRTICVSRQSIEERRNDSWTNRISVLRGTWYKTYRLILFPVFVVNSYLYFITK